MNWFTKRTVSCKPTTIQSARVLYGSNSINIKIVYSPFLLFVFYSCYHGRLNLRDRPRSDLRGGQWSGVFVSHWLVISSDFPKSKQSADLANWFTVTGKKCWNGIFLTNVASELGPTKKSLHPRNGMLRLNGRKGKETFWLSAIEFFLINWIKIRLQHQSLSCHTSSEIQTALFTGYIQFVSLGAVHTAVHSTDAYF